MSFTEVIEGQMRELKIAREAREKAAEERRKAVAQFAAAVEQRALAVDRRAKEHAVASACAPGSAGEPDGLGPDEPYFVLRASDPAAPVAVRLWAAQRWQDGGDPGEVAAARACADAMESWYREHRSR